MGYGGAFSVTQPGQLYDMWSLSLRSAKRGFNRDCSFHVVTLSFEWLAATAATSADNVVFLRRMGYLVNGWMPHTRRDKPTQT